MCSATAIVIAVAIRIAPTIAMANVATLAIHFFNCSCYCCQFSRRYGCCCSCICNFYANPITNAIAIAIVDAIAIAIAVAIAFAVANVVAVVDIMCCY